MFRVWRGALRLAPPQSSGGAVFCGGSRSGLRPSGGRVEESRATPTESRRCLAGRIEAKSRDSITTRALCQPGSTSSASNPPIFIVGPPIPSRSESKIISLVGPVARQRSILQSLWFTPKNSRHTKKRFGVNIRSNVGAVRRRRLSLQANWIS